MNRFLTEEGEIAHTCKWQKLEEKADGTIVLVCTHPGCPNTKIVEKPKVQESKSTKRLLVE